MIGSLGGSAREEGLVCTESRGPRSATNVDIARHEAQLYVRRHKAQPYEQ